MKMPATPETELSRLNTLTSLEILDTEEEERFNRLTRIAKKTFNVPIALVSLVDENRQWFKSCLGLDVRQTSRKISFCGHAILENKILVIEDAKMDDRFFDNPLVTESPFIRFYAGCPLTVFNARIGTLCIIDTKKRKFYKEDIAVLQDLTLLVESELVALQKSSFDDLTKILNRRGIVSLIQSGINLGVRENSISTVLFFDLDGFKEINDLYGHEEGDKVLKYFADIIQKASRSADVLGRLGGDEFIVWLSNSDKESSQKYIDRLETFLSTHNNNKNSRYELSFSVGMVEIDPNAAIPIEEIIKNADELMYKNKKSRRKN